MSLEKHKLREALQKIRLHGSPWWKDEWGTPSAIANEALLEADLALSAAPPSRRPLAKTLGRGGPHDGRAAGPPGD